MNKLFIAILAISALLLSACVPVATMYVCPDGSSVSDPSLCKPKDVAPVVTPAVKEPEPAAPVETPVEDVVVKEKVLTPAAKALFDKIEKANNVKFNYFTSEDPTVQDRYLVSKYRMKLDLINKAYFTDKDMYDTIYLDFRNQDAGGYCERQSSDSCPDKDKKYDVSYNKYKIRTPFQWLDFVETADVTGRSKQLEGKTAKEIKFEAEDKEGTMWLDSYFGLPLEVEFAGVQYKFQNTFINDAVDADLYHPIMME